MRAYPTNSPQAAARIVALTLIADGHVCETELDVLKRTRAFEMLGLDPGEAKAVMQGLCEDLMLAHSYWGDARRIDERTLGQMAAEIDDPGLRVRVLRYCVAVVEADGLITHGESYVLVNLVERWGLQANILKGEVRIAEAA
jgi:hypothetical protein